MLQFLNSSYLPIVRHPSCADAHRQASSNSEEFARPFKKTSRNEAEASGSHARPSYAGQDDDEYEEDF